MTYAKNELLERKSFTHLLSTRLNETTLCYDAIKMLVELFDLLVVRVLGWCISPKDCDVFWSRRNPDGDESAGDRCAADDATYSCFSYNECHPMPVFRVFSAIPDLVSLVRGSFPTPGPPDLGKAQDVPSISL